MDSQSIKKRLRAMTERIIVDFNEFNHLVQFDRKLDEAEKIIQYMEDKHILRLERAKAAAGGQVIEDAPVKKKVSKKKRSSAKPESDKQDAEAPKDYVVSDAVES